MSRFIRNSEVQAPWSGSGTRAKPVQKHCAACGAGLMDRRKTYCGPCYDRRLQENIAANRRKYYKPKRER